MVGEINAVRVGGRRGNVDGGVVGGITGSRLGEGALEFAPAERIPHPCEEKRLSVERKSQPVENGVSPLMPEHHTQLLREAMTSANRDPC